MKSLIYLGIVMLPSLVFANDGYSRMEALDDKIKNKLLLKAVSVHQLSCESLVKNIPQGEDEKGEGYWTVFCADGEAYSVRVSNDERSAIRVTPCNDVHESRLACAEDTASLAAE